MIGSLRGAALFLVLGVSWSGCSSKHDSPPGTAAGSSGVGGSTRGEAGSGAAGLVAQAGAGPGDAAGSAGSASGEGGTPDAAGSGSAGSSHGGAQNGSAGSADSASSADSAGSSDAGGACQAFEASLSTTAPTVFVLVDRSSSMFLCLSGTAQQATLNCSDASDTPWGKLKQSMLEVVHDLQGSVRFAFGSFTGERPASCPTFSSVGAALNNYEVIRAAYDAIAAPMFKAETPTEAALGRVQALLAADPSPGRKYVFLVTDGEPDFCDDGSPVCPVDATVSKLQTMYSAGFGTLVMGVDSPLTSISGASLQAFANAGAGQPVSDPSGLGTNLYYSCAGTPSWMTLFEATGKASPAPIASYGTPLSNATVYRPDLSNAGALKQALAGPVAGVKSCTFDLAPGLWVDLGALSSATVSIQGEVVAQSASNGWSMTDGKRLQLNGSACSSWRTPESQKIEFDFPCGSVKHE